MLLSVLVRRSFGLESGYYDVALGVANSILFYSSLGLSGSLPKFIPELQFAGGRRAAAQLIVRLGIDSSRGRRSRLVLALNVWAEPLARALDLGPDGHAVPAPALCAARRPRRARLRLSRARIVFSAVQRQPSVAHPRRAGSSRWWRSPSDWDCI